MYTFKKVDNQWWFVCDSVDKLLEYEDKTYHSLFRKYINAIRQGKVEENVYLLAELLAMDENSTTFQGLNEYIQQSELEKIACIESGKAIWLNEDGGWNCGLPQEQVLAEMRKKMLLFPTYFEQDIRIKRFMGEAKGTHFYAYIGNVEVCEFINGQKIIKWDTYEEAYERALRYCYRED